MAKVTHKKEATGPDSNEAALVQPSDWNEEHEVTGLDADIAAALAAMVKLFDVVIPAGASLNQEFDHGFGVEPSIVKVELVCTAAVGGYDVGDVQYAPFIGGQTGLIAAWANASKAGIATGARWFVRCKKDYAATVAVTSTNWRARLRVVV